MIEPKDLFIYAMIIIALLTGVGIWLARRKGLRIGPPHPPPKPKPRPLVPMPPEGWQPPPPHKAPLLGEGIRDLSRDRDGRLPITIENFEAIVRHVLREEGLIK